MNNLLKKLIPPSAAHKKKFVLFASVGVFIAGVFLVLNVSLFARSIVLNAALEEPYKRFDLYRAGVANYPSEERKEYLKGQEEAIRSTFSELRGKALFWDTVIGKNSDTISPLTFKETLFLVKSEVRERARKKNIRMPRDFGFSKWEKKLPPSHKLNDLFQALETAREVGTLAVASEVSAVLSITVPEIEEAYFENGDENTKYFRRRIEIELTGEFKSIMTYVQKILASDFFFVFRSCDLVAQGDRDTGKKDTEQKPRDKTKKKSAANEIVAYLKFDQIHL